MKETVSQCSLASKTLDYLTKSASYKNDELKLKCCKVEGKPKSMSHIGLYPKSHVYYNSYWYIYLFVMGDTLMYRQATFNLLSRRHAFSSNSAGWDCAGFLYNSGIGALVWLNVGTFTLHTTL